jgi:hypothetical protein
VRRAPLRRFPYSLFFVIENEALLVIACFHGSRDPARWRLGKSIMAFVTGRCGSRRTKNQTGLVERIGTDVVRCPWSSTPNFCDPAALTEISKVASFRR